ncbi:hypothetical protein E2320_002521 [Naja naja]|nr:hypothetical protein E2320_002521 [Naja naja]
MWKEYYSQLFTDTSCSGLAEPQNDLSFQEKIFYPPPLFKCHIDRWAFLLVGLFIHINISCQIPAGWEFSTVVIIYKKGDNGDPSNYRPINQSINQSVIEKNLLPKEQIIFGSGHSIIDNSFILCHLVEKYIGNQLFTTFTDFIIIFNKQGLALEETYGLSMNSSVLSLIKALY